MWRCSRLKNERYRNEWNYRITPGEQALLRCRLRPLLTPDPHAQNGVYTIRSLYFDDFWDSAYREKEDGICHRKKYRIRVYNFSDRTIRLERKKKAGSYICKEDAPLTRAQVEDILAGRYGFLLQSPHSLCREFYIECVCHGMRPRTIVDYEREPWVYEPGQVRLTFDSSVRAAVGGWDLFDPGLPALNVLDPGTLVLEVKFTGLLPGLVRQLLPPKAAEFTALSKYVLCREKTEYRSAPGGWTDLQGGYYEYKGRYQKIGAGRLHHRGAGPD